MLVVYFSGAEGARKSVGDLPSAGEQARRHFCSMPDSRNWKADLGGVQVAKRPMMDVHFSFTVVALVSVMIAINPELGSKA